MCAQVGQIFGYGHENQYFCDENRVANYVKKRKKIASG